MVVMWGVALLAAAGLLCVAGEMGEGRRPANEAEMRFWLENMVGWHRFSRAECAAATGMTEAEVGAALTRLGIREGERPERAAVDRLIVLPYPGGRHPRIGFLDGAVRPQRETKVSVFAPWDTQSYAVVDVPEAIFSNLGLTYLAHTHISTIWTEKGVELERLEWKRGRRGALEIERKLPNGIVFGATVTPERSGVGMELWLKNGTKETLRDLRVQNCVMLKGMVGFAQQTNENKVFASPFAACRSEDGKRWVITVWERCGRAWGNAPCPCLHSDPVFADCAPGETQRLRGWLSFYEGEDVEGEMKRLRGVLPFLRGN